MKTRLWIVCSLFIGARLISIGEAATCSPLDTSLLTPHIGAMIGEVHGTNEAPEFVSRVVCNIAATGRAVVLALEYPRAEQSELDAYMGSHENSAESQFLDTKFWTQKSLDGRQSQGWLMLLRRIRQWKAQKLPISVSAYDVPASADQDRETYNATFLSGVLERAQGSFVVIYSGNVHAKKIRGVTGGDPSFEPTGYRLKAWDLLHLNIGTLGGSAWVCSSPAPSDCGPHSWPANLESPLDLYSIRLGYRSDAYDGVYFVGALTASPPAVLAGRREGKR